MLRARIPGGLRPAMSVSNVNEEEKLNVFMGVDVSKGYADFTLLDDSGEEIMESFQLDDTHSRST